MKITTEITTEITGLFFQGLEEELHQLTIRLADLQNRARAKELTEDEWQTLRYTRERIEYCERQLGTIADLICFAQLKEMEAL